MKTMMALSALVVGLFCNPLFSPEAAAAAQPGRDYTLVEPLRPVSGGPVEVLDFFAYPSAQCYRQQQSLAQWSAAMPGNVRLVHVPVILDPSRDESMARLYHTLQFLEQPDLLHDEIYKEVHVHHLDLNNQLSSKPARLDFIQHRLLTNPRFFGGFVFLIGKSGDFRIQAETRRILQFLL